MIRKSLFVEAVRVKRIGSDGQRESPLSVERTGAVSAVVPIVNPLIARGLLTFHTASVTVIVQLV